MQKYKARNILIAILILLGTASLSAQKPDIIWSKLYGGTEQDGARDIRMTTDGGYIVTAYTFSFGAGQIDAWLLKMDSKGDTTWTKTFGGPYTDHGFASQQTFDGGYITVGLITPSGAPYDIYLIKTDSLGNTLWTKTHGTATSIEYGYSVQVTSDSGYIIAGALNNYGPNGQDVYLVKTDASGDTTWTKTYGGTADECGNWVEQTSDGGYIVVGYTSANGRDVYLIKTDSLGDTLWTKTYAGTGYQTGNRVRQTSDSGYIIAGIARNIYGFNNVYLVKTDASGDTTWTKTYGMTLNSDAAHDVQQTSDGNYIVAGHIEQSDAWILKISTYGDTIWTLRYGDTLGIIGDWATAVQQTANGGYTITGRSGSLATGRDVWIFRLTPDALATDDDSALAYNGNKHLVREINSEILHIVYVTEGHIIYTRSTNGGSSWDALENLGVGEFPAICLDFQGDPCVTWTNGDTLVYVRNDSVQGWTGNKYLFSTLQPSHPVITVTTSDDADMDSVHIIARLSVGGASPSNAIKEVLFPITNPSSYLTRTLESSSGLNMIILDYPSVVRNYADTLNAVWMHGDTVWYGTRGASQSSWSVLSDPFYPDGNSSNHPFVEAYGDSIFTVWQNDSDEEIYRASRHLTGYFSWANLSETSTTQSLYAVNSSGMVTTFTDETPFSSVYDVFWKTKPGATLHNLSNTGSTRSIFPQASLRFVEEHDTPYQYTIWQEGNASPYEIKCKKTTINPQPQPAYFTSMAGFERPSLYLVERDSFISDWQIPVDIGNERVGYQFTLDPIYRYKLKAIAFHESVDKWKMKLTIDGEEMAEIEYEAYVPETLELWIPDEFYVDRTINVTFECDDGSFAAVGPIYIYQYEYEQVGSKSQASGPMVQKSYTLNSKSVKFSPNPFIKTVSINFQTHTEVKLCMKAYDVTGRVVKDIYNGTISGNRMLKWNGDDNHGRKIAQGVYFLRVENINTGEVYQRKLVKMK